MGQGSRWAAVVYRSKRVELIVNSKKKQMAWSKWAKNQDGLLLFTLLRSQKRVELAVNSKKETNGRVRMGQESRWAVAVEIGC